MKRIQGKLFIPNKATLLQVHAVLYWMKGNVVHFEEVFLNTEGIIVEFWVKEEHITHMIKELNACEGLLIEKKEIENIFQV